MIQRVSDDKTAKSKQQCETETRVRSETCLATISACCAAKGYCSEICDFKQHHGLEDILFPFRCIKVLWKKTDILLTQVKYFI